MQISEEIVLTWSTEVRCLQMRLYGCQTTCDDTCFGWSLSLFYKLLYVMLFGCLWLVTIITQERLVSKNQNMLCISLQNIIEVQDKIPLLTSLRSMCIWKLMIYMKQKPVDSSTAQIWIKSLNSMHVHGILKCLILEYNFLSCETLNEVVYLKVSVNVI